MASMYNDCEFIIIIYYKNIQSLLIYYAIWTMAHTPLLHLNCTKEYKKRTYNFNMKDLIKIWNYGITPVKIPIVPLRYLVI